MNKIKYLITYFPFNCYNDLKHTRSSHWCQGCCQNELARLPDALCPLSTPGKTMNFNSLHAILPPLVPHGIPCCAPMVPHGIPCCAPPMVPHGIPFCAPWYLMEFLVVPPPHGTSWNSLLYPPWYLMEFLVVPPMVPHGIPCCAPHGTSWNYLVVPPPHGTSWNSLLCPPWYLMEFLVVPPMVPHGIPCCAPHGTSWNSLLCPHGTSWNSLLCPPWYLMEVLVVQPVVAVCIVEDAGRNEVVVDLQCQFAERVNKFHILLVQAVEGLLAVNIDKYICTVKASECTLTSYCKQE